DGSYWHAGDMRVGAEEVRSTLAGLPASVHAGWIPDCFDQVRDRTFCFLQIDVDLYQPTLDSLHFFYPRMMPGGIILSDDYGFESCPGARRAFDEFMQAHAEPIAMMPTGQAFVIKRATRPD